MERIQIHITLTPEQKKKLLKRSIHTGSSMAEIIRTLINEFMDDSGNIIISPRYVTSATDKIELSHS